ncbi:hypothetical protein pb186bvf_009689 [Paramecium bursaria]
MDVHELQKRGYQHLQQCNNKLKCIKYTWWVCNLQNIVFDIWVDVSRKIYQLQKKNLMSLIDSRRSPDYRMNQSFINQNNEYNKHLLVLTTQVEKLTQALQQKQEELEYLQQNQQEPEEMEELIRTVEIQTQEIEKWANKYTQLEDVCLKQKQQIEQLLKEKDQLSQKEYLKPRSSFLENTRNSSINEDFKQQLNRQKQENEKMRQQYEQRLSDLKEINRELLAAEEERVRSGESRRMEQMEEDFRNQLNNYKDQLIYLQNKISDQKLDNPFKQQIDEKNRVIEEQSKLINYLRDELHEKNLKLKELLRQQNDSIYKEKTSRYQSPTNINDEIHLTLNQINSTIMQVDDYKQMRTNEEYKMTKPYALISRSFRDNKL